MWLTDRVFDNLSEEALITTIKKDTAQSAQEIATNVVKEALKYRKDPKKIVPFREKAKAAGRKSNLTGGKPDDISVVVAIIT